MSAPTFVVEAGHIMMFERSLGGAASYRADALAPLTGLLLRGREKAA